MRSSVPAGVVEHIEAHTSGASRVVITVEHASNALPEPWRWPAEDAHLAQTHWAVDLGVAAFARQLARQLGVPAALSRFSRLLVDPNRPLDSDTLFRETADGQPIAFNTALSAAEKARRIEGYYKPYHAAVAALVGSEPHAAVLGLHSFTPNYQGQIREVQVGVLFDRDEDLAHAFAHELAGHGYDVRLNEPWSGRDGLIYGPQSHADRYRRPCLELELRQDLLADPGHVRTLLGLVGHATTRVFGASAR